MQKMARGELEYKQAVLNDNKQGGKMSWYSSL